MLGGTLTAIGSALAAIVGIIYLVGYTPLEWLLGLTGLLLGVGLLLFMRQWMSRESGREARERTASRRVSHEAHREARKKGEASK